MWGKRGHAKHTRMLLQVILECKQPLGEMCSTANPPSNFAFPLAKSFWGSNPEFLGLADIPALSHPYCDALLF